MAKKKKRQRMLSRTERLEATAMREAVAFARGERTHGAKTAKAPPVAKT